MITDGTYNKYSLWRIEKAHDIGEPFISTSKASEFVEVFSDHFEAVDWVKNNGKRGEKYLIIQGDVLIVK